MNRAPLSIVTIAFIIGILVARYTNIPFVIFWILSFLTILFSIAFLRSKTKFLTLLFFSILFLGSVAFSNSQSLPSNHISNFTLYKGAPVYLGGIIDSDPEIKAKFTSFIFKTEGLIKDNREKKVCGKVLVKAFGERDLLYGDRLLIKGTLYKAPYFRISKNLNYRDYLRKQNIYSILILIRIRSFVL